MIESHKPVLQVQAAIEWIKSLNVTLLADHYFPELDPDEFISPEELLIEMESFLNKEDWETLQEAIKTESLKWSQIQTQVRQLKTQIFNSPPSTDLGKAAFVIEEQHLKNIFRQHFNMPHAEVWATQNPEGNQCWIIVENNP